MKPILNQPAIEHILEVNPERGCEYPLGRFLSEHIRVKNNILLFQTSIIFGAQLRVAEHCVRAAYLLKLRLARTIGTHIRMALLGEREIRSLDQFRVSRSGHSECLVM